jgi:hypothetical protein
MLRDDGLSAETDPDLISTEDEESRLLDSSGVFHPPPPGTKWEDVKITLTASDTVRIETPHGKGKYTYHTLGMADGRCADKSKEVWTTFSLFAVNHGVVPQKGAITFIDNLTEKAKRLNKHLKDLFKINDRIFKHNFKKYHRHETKIVFSNQMEITVPENERAESAFELGTEDTKNFTNESTPWD